MDKSIQPFYCTGFAGYGGLAGAAASVLNAPGL